MRLYLSALGALNFCLSSALPTAKLWKLEEFVRWKGVFSFESKRGHGWKKTRV